MIGRRGWEAVGAPAPESIRRRVVIAGRVFDEKTQAPLAAAVVEICALAKPQTGRSWQTMTRADGTYAFTGLPEGKYRLHVYIQDSSLLYGEFTGEYQITIQDPPQPPQPQWIEVQLPSRVTQRSTPPARTPGDKRMVSLTSARRAARNKGDKSS
jgi:Carboxypeptidase regulatory-like domain